VKHTLLYYGNPLLRKKCQNVEEVTPQIRELALEMIAIMDAKRGVGLAASQVGELIRIFVIRPEVTLPNNEITLGKPEVFINPRLYDPSKEVVVMAEGCLSLPGLHVELGRPMEISVDALDFNGNPITLRATGFKARELMHENDHLNGVLFIDRLPVKVKKEIEPILRDIKQKHA
jgi:peptide deformylase